MKKRVSILLVAMLMISIIPNFAFALDLEDEANRLGKIFAELTDEDKKALSDTKAKIYDLSQEEEHKVWIGDEGVFDLLPVDSKPFIKAFGSEDKAQKFVRNFIADLTTTIYFTGSNADELADELEAFVEEYRDDFNAVFESNGEQLLRNLRDLMINVLNDPSKYVDKDDVMALASASTNQELVKEMKKIFKKIIIDGELDNNIQAELDRVNWKADNIFEAAFLLIKEVDPTHRSTLALVNAILRSEGNVAEGSIRPKVGSETYYSIGFFGLSNNMFKFKIDDSNKDIGSFAAGNINPFTASKVGKGTIYVYRTTVDPDIEDWNYIYKFDITVTKKSSGGGGGGGGSDDVEPTTEKPKQIDGEIKVDDENINTTVKEVDGQKVAEVEVDNAALKSIIEKSEKGTTVVVEVDESVDVVQAGFGKDIIALMKKSDISISIRTKTASYTVPAKDLDINALTKALGEDVKAEDVKISIVIAQPTAERIKTIQDQAVKAGVQVVMPPIEFDVVCTDGKKSVSVSKFSSFVERTIKVPDGVNTKNITTAVVQDKEGNLTPVPTEVVKIDDEYHVKIKSMTNSVYAVINNSKNFADVANHWAKNDVNDMGSRLIINGVSDTTFEPNRDITRAEFMTIVVKALGIMRSGEGLDSFDDVKSEDWYYDAVSIAKNYDLTNGNGNGTFTPNSKITREEAMAIISRAMKMAGMDAKVTSSEISKELGAFVDHANISDWAKESVAACVKNGIVGGYDGKISVKNNITRAECATIIKRMLVKAELINEQ